jgi:hypothetical protein
MLKPDSGSLLQNQPFHQGSHGIEEKYAYRRKLLAGVRLALSWCFNLEGSGPILNPYERRAAAGKNALNRTRKPRKLCG